MPQLDLQALQIFNQLGLVEIVWINVGTHHGCRPFWLLGDVNNLTQFIFWHGLAIPVLTIGKLGERKIFQALVHPSDSVFKLLDREAITDEQVVLYISFLLAIRILDRKNLCRHVIQSNLQDLLCIPCGMASLIGLLVSLKTFQRTSSQQGFNDLGFCLRCCC